MEIVQPESIGLSSSRLDRITAAMQGYVDRGEFGGVITLVARQGQVAYLEKFGWQEVATQKPMSFDTIFRIYSMSKPITSTAAMMLVEQGKIRLGDPVSRYIPSFSNLKVMQPRNGCDFELVPLQREPTLHDLFTHSAGLSYGFDDNSTLDALYRKELWALQEQESSPNLEESIAILAKLPLAYQPGSAYRYSMAIDVLGYVVQVAAQQPFDAYLKEKIFDPLGMTDTGFWVPPEKVDRLSVVYGPPKDGALSIVDPAKGSRYTQPARWLSGGGGLVSTIGDYYHFSQMIANQGIFNGARLLSRNTVEWMMQNHLPEGIYTDTEKSSGFGLGGSVLLYPGRSHRPGSAGKFGWGGAANTEWWVDPAEQMQCILMTQYMPGFTIPIVEDFAQTAYQALE